MIIVGVDPGKTTGLAVWRQLGWETPLVTTEVADFNQVPTVLREMLCRQRPTLIACERFTTQPGSRLSAQPEAPWVIGAVRSLAQDLLVRVVYQSPGPAKKIAPNPLLRKINWYTPGGGGHHNDASRHIVLALASYFPDTFAELVGV